MSGDSNSELDTQSGQKSDAEVISDTRRWLERAVIGLGLCPFAANTHLRKQIRFRVSAQSSTDGLLQDLAVELRSLQDADPLECETILLIHPHVLADFPNYNQFLSEADAAVRELGLEGELQIASFHPRYRFAGSGVDDIENFSNRSPYPMLHLLREASVTRAIKSFPGIDEIVDKNKETLRRLGKKGWERLWSET